MLKARHDAIESGELVVLLEDGCDLLWGGDPLGYIWGRMNIRMTVPIKNKKDRPPPYSAINFATNEFHVCPYKKGTSVYTVQCVNYVQTRYPEAKLLLIWDGASYHRYAGMQAALQEVNHGVTKHDWKVACELFVPNAPEQNPVEDSWVIRNKFSPQILLYVKNMCPGQASLFTFFTNDPIRFSEAKTVCLYWPQLI